MATTIAVSDATRKRLMRLKLQEDAKSLDELLGRILDERWESRFRAESERFRARLKEHGLDLEDLNA